MNPAVGPMAGAPMPMMNNGTPNPQQAANMAARQQQINDGQRSILNTYIYEYFIRYQMWDCAKMLANEPLINVHKDGDKDGGVNGVDDAMDTDSKEGVDGRPPNLPLPRLPMPASDSSFLYEWFCLFWDIFNAQRAKGGNGNVSQYVAHTQQQSRMKQSQHQEMLRQMRPDMTPQQFQQAQLMRNMNNGNMNMQMKQGNLARTAMANNQNNPQMQMLQQQGKPNPMQNAGMDPSRDRPASPASGENAPSPSKRPRIDGGVPFNPNQAGPMMANGRPAQGMPGQPLNAQTAAHQLLAAHGINPNSLNPTQLQHFVQMAPPAQAKSIQAYSQTLQQHHGSQMGNKAMPNGAGPQNQGSPMMGGQQDLAVYYNANDIGAAAGGMRPGANNVPNQPGAGSNHALQDYQMQLMLLEQQNKKRLMMARQEQDSIVGAPGQPGPGNQPGPNGQPFPDASPQAMRTGTSPNPTDQMKRGTPQMNNSGIPSPMPEGAQSRGSPNPGMNFMGGDPNMAPPFNMGPQGQMNGMRPPSHPGQPFNGQLNPQQMMARQQQQGGNPQQWQQGQPGQPGQQQPPGGPNGQMGPQAGQGNQQVQGTPQQRAMPPPSAPAAAGNNNSRTTASPQQAAAAPPTPNQGNKAAPKKKESKASKSKAAQKKANQNNAAATPAGDNSAEAEAPTPATPITPVNTASFNKGGPNGNAAPGGQPSAPSAAPPAVSAPPPGAVMPQPTAGDPNQNGGFGMDGLNSMVGYSDIDLANPLNSTGDVLSEFDFDSFLHDGDGNAEAFDFNGTFAMDGGEIGAE